MLLHGATHGWQRLLIKIYGWLCDLYHIIYVTGDKLFFLKNSEILSWQMDRVMNISSVKDYPDYGDQKIRKFSLLGTLCKNSEKLLH